MSLHVLKRKSRRFQVPVSGKKNGFALNGTHRNIGGVLPSANLSKSVTRTRFRGTEPMGNGGCCGTYKRSIHNSGSCCSNDSSIVKTSTKNTSGLINTKYKWVNSSWPRSTVKTMDSMPLNYTQGEYIKEKVADNTICVPIKTDAGINTLCNNCKAASYFIGGKKKVSTMYSKNLNSVPITQSEYMRGLLKKKNCLPTPANKAAFPMTLIKNGCDTDYYTPEEAIAAGLLPEDWQG